MSTASLPAMAPFPLVETRPVDAALARFATGTATRADVVKLVEHAKALGLRQVQVTVKRTKKPRHRQPIRLLGHSGPFSSEDRPVTMAGERVGDGLWSAWWNVADLEHWLAR